MSRRLPTLPLTRCPTVTIVIPCYNYGHYLPSALASVLGQPGVDVDVIIIDDASSDESAAAARKLAAGDDRIRLIVHRCNQGHIATYNEGLEQAQGDYVVLLSADDALPPGSLARATALLEAHPSVGFVYGHPVVFAENPPPITSRVRNWTVWSGQEWIERRCRTGRNCIFNPEVVMRTTVLRAIGGYDPDLPHSGDFEMWMRAATVSDVGRINGPAQGFYRVHLNSMQRTTYAGHTVDLEARLAAFRKILTGTGARIANGEELFATASRALAAFALECARSACDRGRADVEPVDEYIAFAERARPAVRRSRRWRAIARCASGDTRHVDRGLRPLARRVAEDWRWRVRSRRWRWSGV